MLRMTDIPKRKRVLTPEEDAIKNEQQPEKSILRMADLKPTRGRTKLKPNLPTEAEPIKILNMSDLPKRATVARRMELQARKQQALHPPGQKGIHPLAPKVFADYIHNGAWKGRRCFIIGGGPSIKNVDLNLLKGEMVIGINRAYEVCDPSILFGIDSQLWGWIEQGKLGAESKRKFNEYKGYKVWVALHKIFPPDFYLVDADEDDGYRVGTTAKLAYKSNSGYGAVNLAAALGANPIYLLGFDMQGTKQGKQKWYHDGYPVDYGENVYERYIEELNRFAPVLEQSGFEVVNLNPKSALKCFTFGSYKRVIKKRPVIPDGAIQAMTKPGMVTVITPTGDRPLAFALCKHWMEMQTQRPDQWIVVDDGKTPTKAPAWAAYIRRSPRPNDTSHTLNINLKTAIPYIKGSKILIMEDDEYYAPKYVETMAKELEVSEVVGIMRAKYYHLPTGGYTQMGNIGHASLAQTGFKDTFIPELSKIVNGNGNSYVDLRLWQKAMAEQRAYLFLDAKDSLYIGMKGMPGRKGIGQGHDPSMYGKFRDTKRSVLKQWAGQDAKVYLDILDGKLNDANCNTYFPQITGITVVHNTKELFQRAYESVRKFHPDMPIIIVDGSDKNDPCAGYVRSLKSELTTVLQPGYNIGHGKGMCMGIDHTRTPCALIFDSDIEMLKSPVDDMMEMMEQDTFGVGYTEKTAPDGFEWGARSASGEVHDKGEPMKMLHPYFQLLNIAVYRKFHPYVHHGAPCYLTALDIHEQGLSDKIIKEFPGLGHSSGKGWVWEGKPREYIRHDPAGTRSMRRKKGLGEIEGNWEGT